MDVDSSLLPATTTVRSSSSSGGCTDILGWSNTPSFSHFKDWKFNYGADLKAKLLDAKKKKPYNDVLEESRAKFLFVKRFWVDDNYPAWAIDT